jgi:hypothetical protein
MNPNKGTPVYAWTWRVIGAYLGMVGLLIALTIVRWCVL